MPLASKLLVGGVLATILALVTPFWVWVRESDAKFTFGLFHYCRDGTCTSIHDNVMAGMRVPGKSNNFLYCSVLVSTWMNIINIILNIYTKVYYIGILNPRCKHQIKKKSNHLFYP